MSEQNFGLGKMKELVEAFKKAEQVQKKVKRLQVELEQPEVVSEAGGGLVKVSLNGSQEPVQVIISPNVIGESAEVVSDLVLAAMKDAHTRSTTIMREKMEALTGAEFLNPKPLA